MVNVKNNSIELSAQKIKNLEAIIISISPEKIQKFNFINNLLTESKNSLELKIQLLININNSLLLNKDSINFFQLFLHSCQQQHQLICFLQDSLKIIINGAEHFKLEQNISADLMASNLPIINNSFLSLQKIIFFNKFCSSSYQSIKENIQKYYDELIVRHTSNNINIYHNIIITDFCFCLINSTKNDNIKNLKDHLRDEWFLKYIIDSELFFSHLENDLKFILHTAENLQNLLSTEISNALAVAEINAESQEIKRSYLDNIVSQIKNCDMNNIQYQKNNSLSDDTKIQHINQTIEVCAKHLLNRSFNSIDAYNCCLDEIEKMQELSSVSGFYICKIATGNPDKGESSGALELVPKQKPNVTLDNIVGSGFEEIKNFITTIKFTSQWNDLFLATSPSKTTDKNNVLLIGPPGCGKTEILRAVASDPDSISVFAQGSDFLTCWRGEAEKNPKRLFEAGLELQRKSKKHVYFLIDEIDSVLNAGAPGEINLSLEFQVLMDGIVQYPGLSVWGATNFPEKIPPAMIRRFSKTSIVGELSQEHRIVLLKHFINFMPCKDFAEQDWDVAANKLAGATGNVVRKIADQVWRDKMMQFVNQFPEQASDLVNWLNQDGKFDINNFSSDKKEKLKNKLLNYIAVEPEYLNKTIDSHINSLAVKSEIQTAVTTYANAKRILGQL